MIQETGAFPITNVSYNAIMPLQNTVGMLLQPTGIMNHTVNLLLVVIGLLSGVLSVLREIQEMYLPPKIPKKKHFWAVVRIAFVIAAVVLWCDEHAKVLQLQRSDPVQIRLELKKRMVALSRELSDFSQEWMKHSPGVYNMDDVNEKKEPQRYRQELARRSEEALKREREYDLKAIPIYNTRYRQKVVDMCKEATDAGLNVGDFDRVQAFNGMVFQTVSGALAKLADKL
jgi:hypothetical protein